MIVVEVRTQSYYGVQGYVVNSPFNKVQNM